MGDVTLEFIRGLVKASAQLTDEERVQVARSLPITACAIYCLECEKAYEKKVSI